jgi:hypothetical protein
METTWLLIALTLLPAEDRPRDLTGEIIVTYYQTLNECRKEAIESDQRIKEHLKKQFKGRGIDEAATQLSKKAGIVDMAICWNGKEARLIYPETIDSPWLAVVARFTPVSYVDKRSARREKLGMGIARVGRFKTSIECRKGLSNASTELERSLKPDEQKALICLPMNQG